jgi:hypothetical protein
MFTVLTIERDIDNSFNVSRSALRFKFSYARLEVSRCSDHKVFYVNTHLGDQLDLNDTVLCYDLSELNLDDVIMQKDYNPIIIVKKCYPRYQAALHERYWHLNHFDKCIPDLYPNEYEAFKVLLEEDP